MGDIVCPDDKCPGAMVEAEEDGYLKCDLCGSTVKLQPPTLKPGDEVWVRGVVEKQSDINGIYLVRFDGGIGFYVPIAYVPISSIKPAKE